MTDAVDNLEEMAAEEIQATEDVTPEEPPVWLRASAADLIDLDFEAAIIGSQSADANELGQQFRTAIGSNAPDAGPETSATRVYSMLIAVMDMHMKASEPNEPFGPMVTLADGRRSAAPVDFRGAPAIVLAEMAERAKHPV